MESGSTFEFHPNAKLARLSYMSENPRGANGMWVLFLFDDHDGPLAMETLEFGFMIEGAPLVEAEELLNRRGYHPAKKIVGSGWTAEWKVN